MLDFFSRHLFPCVRLARALFYRSISIGRLKFELHRKEVRLAWILLRVEYWRFSPEKIFRMPKNPSGINHPQSVTLLVLLGFILSPALLSRADTLPPPSSQQPKSRQKRILWVTEDGRLALPPGTTMVISPSLSMPFVRHPPKGFFSNLTISLPFTIDFDKLGLTDNENPFGDVPPLLSRSMGRAAGGILADYIGNMLENRRAKRDIPKPAETSGDVQGGERALLYIALEELLENFGLDGRACLLRAICEVHAHPMKGFGLVGEMLKLFLSASKSPYSHLMREYIEAENAGRGLEGPAECWPYMRDCSKSLFASRHDKYRQDNNKEEDGNEIPTEEERVEKVSFDPSAGRM